MIFNKEVVYIHIFIYIFFKNKNKKILFDVTFIYYQIGFSFYYFNKKKKKKFSNHLFQQSKKLLLWNISMVLAPKKQNVRLGRMSMIMNPSLAHLNSKSPPFRFREKMVLRIFSADLLWENDVPVLVHIVVVLV